MSTARTTEMALSSRSRAGAYVALTKPDVSFLVLITTAAGYYMGARGPVNWLHMLQTVFATMLIAAGTAALNHYIERESDRYMRRTAMRPLPSGVLQPTQALVFGIGLSVAGAFALYYIAGWIAAALGVITCIGYLFGYNNKGMFLRGKFLYKWLYILFVLLFSIRILDFSFLFF